MNQKHERIYTTEKVNTFLRLDKKVYIGCAAAITVYLGACMVAFIDYILNRVDIVHIAAVILLFVVGLVPAWIFAEGYQLSKQAAEIEKKLLTVTEGVISWKALSKLCGRKNSVRLVDRMIRKGFLTGIRINVEHKAIILEENYRLERRNR